MESQDRGIILLTICLRKPSFPLCHCCPRPQQEALGFLAGPCCALPSPTASALQPQVPPPAARRQGCVCLLLFEPGTVKGPVRGFSEGRRSGVWAGLILNHSNIRSLLASPCVDGNCSARPHAHIRSMVSIPGLMLSFTFTMVYNVHNTPTIWVWLLLPSFLLRGKMDLESEAICPPSHSSMWNQHSWTQTSSPKPILGTACWALTLPLSKHRLRRYADLSAHAGLAAAVKLRKLPVLSETCFHYL